LLAEEGVGRFSSKPKANFFSFLFLCQKQRHLGHPKIREFAAGRLLSKKRMNFEIVNGSRALICPM
jgi:hypothetical protein